MSTKVVPQNSQKNTCAKTSVLAEACDFIKKESLAQMLSCEFRDVFKSIFFKEHLRRLPLCLVVRHPAIHQVYRSAFSKCKFRTFIIYSVICNVKVIK